MGYLLIFLIILAAGGWQTAGPMLKNIAAALWDVLKWIVDMIIRFPDLVGVTDAVYSRVLYLVVMGVLTLMGVGVTARTRHKILGLCVSAIGIFSLLNTLAG